MKRWWIIGSVVLAIIVVSWIFLRASSREPVQVALVKQTAIREYVDERGKTRLPRIHSITMPFAARIEEITLELGDSVKQGEVVASVSISDLDDALAEAQAVVDRLEASIRKNDDVRVEESTRKQAISFVESMNATVAAAEARMTAGEKREAVAKKALDRALQLFQRRATTDDEMERADLQHVEAKVNYRQDVLVTQATKAIAAATGLLPQMVSDYISRKSLTRAVLEKEKLQAEARLRQMTTRKQRGTMRSPVNGLVLERPVFNEQFLSAGTLLMKVGDLSELEVETDVLSQDVVRIRPGNTVEIYGPAVGAPVGQGIPGVVTSVQPAGFSKISSLGVEQQRVKVIVQLLPQARQLLSEKRVGVGYRVRVRIYTNENRDAQVIPRTALFRGPGGDWQVFVESRGRLSLRSVQVGLMNDEMAEIRSGIDTSEAVVLAPSSQMVDGMRVKRVLPSDL